MNKIKPVFRVEIGTSEKGADITKIREKKKNFVMYLWPIKFKSNKENFKSMPLAFQKL